MSDPVSLDLSVIIPLFNETPHLPALFETLGAQKEVLFEAVFSDGGSTDGTTDRARELGRNAPFSSRVVVGEKGRGRQLNAGAHVARGRYLLFLHADSSFLDPHAFHRGIRALEEAAGDDREGWVAGHFALSFSLQGAHSAGLFYYYYEWKARLNRPECTHGDQGFLLSRAFFDEIGPFDSGLPFLEDTRLAERIRTKGRWTLLPSEIHTSARRFETEGRARRQILNALLRGAAAADWSPFFHVIPDLYRSQDRADKLLLLPFLRKITALLRSMSFRDRLRLWTRVGGYVSKQAWQIPFFFDVRRHYRYGTPAGEGPTPLLARFDRSASFLVDHRPGRWAASVLTWVGFYALWIGCRLWEGERPDYAPEMEEKS
jgi:rSAM/selenodomain-associated transferase 2